MKKVGLFFCQAPCIEGPKFDLQYLADSYQDSAATVHVFHEMLSRSSIDTMVRLISTHKLDAVVLAGCSPEFIKSTIGGEALLEELMSSGVNPNMIFHANLREQCLLAHPKATEEVLFRKARALTDVALASASIYKPCEVIDEPPHRKVLVVGAGEAALLAAYHLVRNNLRVNIVHPFDDWRYASEYRSDMNLSRTKLEGSHLFNFRTATEVIDVAGWAGDYEVTLTREGESAKERYGAIIAAVGKDYPVFQHLWSLLQIDFNADGAPQARNQHTLATRSAVNGISIVLPSNAALSTDDQFRDQSLQAGSAAMDIMTLLYAPWMRHNVAVSRVASNECGLCRTCTKVCAFNACSIDERLKTSIVDIRRCKSCGNCVVACPAGARDLITNPTGHISKAIEIFQRARKPEETNIMAFLCAGCAYRAADAAGMDGHPYPAGLYPLKVVCGGRVDMQHILQAFETGFDGVLLGCCREGHCHNLVGHLYLDRRVVLIRNILESRGINPERLRILDISPHEGELFAKAAGEFTEEIQRMTKGEGR